MVEFLHLGVRLLHLLAMALVIGGAAHLWFASRRATAGGETVALLPAAIGYEWLFWGATGVVVATGVGNLGALAPGIGGPGTPWGLVLAVKLAVVLAFLLGSAVRTVLVDRLDRTAPSNDAAIRRTLRVSYGLTALSLVVVVALATVLAHG